MGNSSNLENHKDVLSFLKLEASQIRGSNDLYKGITNLKWGLFDPPPSLGGYGDVGVRDMIIR